MFSKRSVIWLLILCCLLGLVTLPRFNRNDFGIQSLTTGGAGNLGDSAQYTAITLYFRGEKSEVKLRPPFTYRPLVPFLAAQLPFDAMTAINMINLFAMAVAVFFMYGILTWFEFCFWLRIIGCGLFVVSFPTFYYTTIGCIDPVLISLLTIGVYLLFTNKWVYLAIVIIFGVFVKETIVVLILIFLAYLIIYRRIFTQLGLIFLLILLFSGIAYFVARSIIPVSSIVGWVPMFETLIFNMSRPRSWLSSFLSFGIPGSLAVFIIRYRNTDWFKEGFKEMATLITGLVLSIFLVSYSMLSAYSDGRFIWTSYPFSIPLAMFVLMDISKKRGINHCM